MESEWQLVANADWLKGQIFPLTGHTVLGRDSSCDITIPGTHLSRRHAEIAINGNKLQVRDLGSSNGTFVNGERITQAELYPGDQIQFDVLTFSVEGPASAMPGTDPSATIIRTVVNPRPTPAETAAAQTHGEKRWKTKPTSVGNREDTIHIPAAKKAVNWLGLAITATLALATVAAVGYLITLL